ncbi:MAG: hypothetical protein ACTSVI_05725 [Promethearchaeota archaeon]
MASAVIVLRKIFGIALLVVNLLLSLTSFLAAYSSVHFATDPDNYKINISVQNGLTSSPAYLYIGNVEFNNSGLFDFSNFSIEIYVENESDYLMRYTSPIYEIKAGTSLVIDLNITEANADFNPAMLANLTAINWTAIDGYLRVNGKYAFSLFDFQLEMTNLNDWGLGGP